MSQKPGRNDPCPCGSGKKYKKCCGLNELSTPIIPESERTGTPYDDYMEVLSLLAIYGQKILRFDEDGRELKKAVSDFEKRFRPGKPDGLTDSLFMSWMHFDLRFGPSRKTIAERSLSDPLTGRLVEPGPTLIRRMAESYLTFYEVIEPGDDAVVVEELGTGKRWTVLYVRELCEIEAVRGEIWYTRLIGPDNEAISYTSPYIFDSARKAQFKRAVHSQKKDFSAGPRAHLFPREQHFVESQKEAVLFWAEFILRGLTADFSGLSELPRRIDIDDIPGGSLPLLINTDREEVVFAEVKFRVKDEAALRKRLAALKSFEYDAKDDSWSWLKVGDRKDPEDVRTVYGTFQVKDGFLIAETNSRERATRLKAKLEKLLHSLIAYVGTHWRDQNDLPKLSAGKREASRKENQELNARPEVREALRKHLEHYYLEKWPHQRVPALGGLTPIQAAKTEAGRRKLKELIEFYEHTQEAGRDEAPRLDFDRLRRMLGLPPKAN
jgi:hypothetical protein